MTDQWSITLHATVSVTVTVAAATRSEAVAKAEELARMKKVKPESWTPVMVSNISKHERWRRSL